MVKTRSGDTSQYLDTEMPVKNSVVVKEDDDGSDNSDHGSNKDDSYPQQSPCWSRELRNRFVFSTKDRTRNSGDCNVHPRYGKQGIRSRRHIRCGAPLTLSERNSVYRDGMVEDLDDSDSFDHPEDDDDDDDDDIFSPCRKRVRTCRQRQSYRTHLRSSRTSSRREHRSSSKLNGHDSRIEKQGDDAQEAEGVRRSTRQRKLLYDNFNTSWILGTQTLRGYPMFLPDKEEVEKGCTEGSSRTQERVEEEEEEEGDTSKETCKKKRQPLVEMPAAVDDNFEDMYSRVKRPRRSTRRLMYPQQQPAPRSRKINEDSDDASDSQSSQTSSDSEEEVEVRREKYHLRKTKPTVQRFQVNVDPPRRSSRIFRTVLSSVRRRRHRDDSSSSSSEEERFDRKKVKGHGKSRTRCLPINIHTNDLPVSSRPHEASKKLADVNPVVLDTSIRFEDVGGLEEHIRCLKEMVVFPMLYKEVFDRFSIRPPKGVLFHGAPGTGKTLIARALANECCQGDRKVSFFMRKGADCLNKWVGESERQLRLLFEQAYEMRPSIIFFDEIDGLAPVRSSKQDQIHASIVSTLLALMDGLDNRGDVIVIGATNRIDAIDPALRRPGRFDRELYFPLPAKKERQEILRIHVSRWQEPPPPSLLVSMAEQAVGYCGSDLQALCSEAVIQSLRRRYPQIYNSRQKLLVDPKAVKVDKLDFLRAKKYIVPAAHRVAPCVGRKLSQLVEPLLKDLLGEAIDILRLSFPHSTSRNVIGTGGIHRPQLLLVGDSAAHGQTTHLGPALLHHMEHLPVHTLDLAKLFGVSGCTPEEACIQVFQEARRNTPSVIYVPGISQWWSLVAETLQAVFLSNLRLLNPSIPILLLATSDVPYKNLPHQVKELFSDYRGEVIKVGKPNAAKRRAFFAPIFTVVPLRHPKPRRKAAAPLPELPVAPPPEPRKLSEEEQKVLYEKEEGTLRELRIFLREICAKLARNRQFYMFTKPVDIEEVPDYLAIIKQPMDLETMMTKIDLHRYSCAQDFLDDIDLLCRNALEYNPDREPADKLIRHRACSLRDTAYTLIKAQMDSDFEEQCKVIAKARRERAESPSRFAPEFVLTTNEQTSSKENSPKLASTPVKDSMTSTDTSGGNGSNEITGFPKSHWKFNSDSCLSKKRRRSAWSRGLLRHSSGKKKKHCVRHVLSLSPNAGNNNSNSASTKLDADNITKERVINGPLNIKVEGGKKINGENEPLHLEGKRKSKDDLDCASVTKLAESAIYSVCHTNMDAHADETLINYDNGSQDDADAGHELDISADQEQLNDTVCERNPLTLDKDRLESLLHKAVLITEHCAAETLLELYAQLRKCVLKYSNQWDRRQLPQDLDVELRRFQEHYSQLL
ncbi:ATPase family AAA domain-containing protein 2-like [Schistocerca piceifrons]|uniref:ATPase family AAA domain-containing protein 2-like n=1 Tax=Schistocerca piceifrons TaxID=274613 RepID=UPI001F5F2119|nr:ATPase family AAA domain-containing protein 2-like [Schistocerca piceifrons]